MRLRHSWILLAVLAIGTSAAPLVSAAGPTNAAAAESLFNEGRALLDKGDFEQACDRFTKSDRLDPAVGTSLNLGECFEHLGKLASAWLAFRRTVTLADARGDERRSARALQAAAALEPRLPRLTVRASMAATSMVVVMVNGTRIEEAALGTALPVDPGMQAIEVSAPNRKAWRTRVDASEGRAVVVDVPVLEASEAGPPRNMQRTLGIGLEIGGSAVLAAGLVLGGLAIARWSSVKDGCPEARCPSEAVRQANTRDADATRTLSTLSTITTLAGAAALATGIVLHLTARGRGVTLDPIAGPTALGLVLTVNR